jgi:hypothetical protein
MHTSVEKHSLRIAKSCGTLAHASRFIIFRPMQRPLGGAAASSALLQTARVLYNQQRPAWSIFPVVVERPADIDVAFCEEEATPE